MRKLIIDTDTGSDDAVALLMALRSPEVEVLGITTVGGNVPLEQATQNALMTVEVCGSRVPVYKGAAKPLFRELVTAVNVHGRDGMGDLGLPPPALRPQREHAVDFLIRAIEAEPGELEMVTLGPVTNLAWLSLRSPGTLAKLKRITMMMGTGPYFGNATPLAEGNARMDPEALDIVLRDAGTELVLVGWDLCINEYLFTEKDLEGLRQTGSPLAAFCLDINQDFRLFRVVDVQ